MNYKGSEEKMIQNQRETRRTVKSAAATLRNVGKSFSSSVQIELTGEGGRGQLADADDGGQDDPFVRRTMDSLDRQDRYPAIQKGPIYF